jgi:hypothetical protein
VIVRPVGHAEGTDNFTRSTLLLPHSLVPTWLKLVRTFELVDQHERLAQVFGRRSLGRQ